MDKDLKLRFEEEKKRLIEEFAPVKKSWWKSDNVKYKTTLEIASTTTYKLNKQDFYEVYYNRIPTIIFLTFIIAAFVLISFASYTNDEFNPFICISISGFLIAALVYNCLQIKNDKQPKFRFDKEGMFYEKDNFYLKWINVVDTYIKYDSNGEDVNHILLVRYYDDATKCFETKEINIDGYNYNFESIAYAITVVKDSIVF